MEHIGSFVELLWTKSAILSLQQLTKPPCMGWGHGWGAGMGTGSSFSRGSSAGSPTSTAFRLPFYPSGKLLAVSTVDAITCLVLLLAHGPGASVSCRNVL